MSTEHPRRPALSGWVQRALVGVGGWCFVHPIVALVCFSSLVGLAALSASRLEVEPDLASLLPPEYESVRDVETLKERFGGVGYVVILVRGDTGVQRLAFAKLLHDRLAASPRISYVEFKRPSSYLKEKALWLLDYSDLEELRQRVHRRYSYEINRKFLDFDDEPPPEVEVEDLFSKASEKFGLFSDASASGKDEKGAISADYYADEKTLALFVRPRELATDFSFTKQVVGEVHAITRSLQIEHPEYAVTWQLAGRYKKRVDLQQVLSSDLGFTGVLALLLVAAYVWLHFRRPFAILLLLLPLCSGLLLAYGIAGLLFGSLNILTAFLGAILLGIGIDSGIHLLGRIHERLATNLPLPEAVALSLGDAGRVSLGASATTAVAFFCLSLTDFRAFREFGLLTGIGVLLVLLSYVILLPAMLSLASRTPWLQAASHSARLPFTDTMLAHARSVVIFVGGFVLLLCLCAPRSHFDADLSRLDEAELPSFHLDSQVNVLLGRSQTPLVVFAKNDAEAAETAEFVRRRMKQQGKQATVGKVMTLSELVPNDIAKKRPVVDDLRKMISHVDQAALESFKARFPMFEEVLQAEAPTREELPASIRHVVAPTSNRGGPLVLLYPTVSLGDSATIERLAAQVRHMELSPGRVVRAVGEPMVIADILRLLAKDGPRILLISFVLIFGVLRITLGSWKLASLATAPALVILLATAGAAAWAGIDFNVLNVVILPILLGVGVDDGAHLVARLEEGQPLSHVWKHTGADVAGAILTDVFGFGALALAAHPGLVSLGQVALIGLGCNFIVCVVLLPAILSLFPRLFPIPTVAPADERLLLGAG